MELASKIKRLAYDYNGKSKLGIELCPQSNAIKFSIIDKSYLYAYVVGDFNNWKKSEEAKLTWQLDTNDGELKMMKVITFNNDLEDGTYRYAYVLEDCEGNEVLLNDWINSDNPFTFKWINAKEKYEIVTSSNSLSKALPLEVIVVKSKKFGDFDVVDTEITIEPQIDGVSYSNNHIFVTDEVKDGTKIHLLAKIDDNIIASRDVFKYDVLDSGTLLHYYRSDNSYSGTNHTWNCWTFGQESGGEEVQLSGDTDIGKCAVIKAENAIIRKKMWGKEWCNEWADQTYSYYIKDSYNKYIISGDNNLYSTLADAVKASKPKIECAILDADRKIKVYLSHEPLLGIEFNLYINGIKVQGTSNIIKALQKEVIITGIPIDINSNDLIEIKATNMYLPCKVLLRNFLDKYYYDGDDLGLKFSYKNISMKLWAPTAYKVEVVLYNDYRNLREKPNKVFKMEYDKYTGVHFTKINRFKNEEKYYLYKLYFKDVDIDGNIIDKVTFAIDPYAVATSVNGQKGYLLDINSNKTKPHSWNKDISPVLINKEDSIIYEVHIRDFTVDENSGVKDKLRGTFLGATQSGTIYKDPATGEIVKTGLDHLVELGITHVHLLPVFDFSSVDETKKNDKFNRNWGYDPQNFNVPEGSYSTNPLKPLTRIKEFREMVNTFHKNGIRVVMDMVYNHMSNTENMDNIVPRYYFRTDSKGIFTNGSGCGNEIASERPMVRKFILDSCIHWVKNYKIDGLRFDLMELIDIDTIKLITEETNKLDNKLIIYGEPWKGGYSPLKNGTTRGSQRNQEFAIFNDIFRDALRGENSPSKGFINGDQHNPSKAWSVVEGIKGSIYTITDKPKETINYLESHDNYSLWDQIIKSQNVFADKEAFRYIDNNAVMENTFVKQHILGMSILFLSQGIPFFQAGSEFLRTKFGDHNSYASSDDINGIRWADKLLYKEVFEYLQGLISLRKCHKAFKNISVEEIKQKISITFANDDDKSGVIICHYHDNVNCDVWKDIVWIINGTTIDGYDVNKNLPKNFNGKWKMVVNNRLSGNKIIDVYESGKIPTIKAHSIMVLYS